MSHLPGHLEPKPLAHREGLLGGGLRPVYRPPQKALEALVGLMGLLGLALRPLDPGDGLVLQLFPQAPAVEEPRAKPAAASEPLDRSKRWRETTPRRVEVLPRLAQRRLLALAVVASLAFTAWTSIPSSSSSASSGS